MREGISKRFASGSEGEVGVGRAEVRANVGQRRKESRKDEVKDDWLLRRFGHESVCGPANRSERGGKEGRLF